MQNVCKKRLEKLNMSELKTLNNVIYNHGLYKEKTNHFHIDILPDFQRQGYGHKLLEALLKKLKKDGENHLIAVKIKKDGGSYNLCIKEGFNIVSYYEDGKVALIKNI